MKNRRSVILLLVALSLVAAACSGSADVTPTNGTATATSTQSDTPEDDAAEPGDDDVAEQPTGQDDDVFEIPGEIGDVTAETLNVSKDSIEFNKPFALADSGCFLQTAYSTESTAFGVNFGVLANGDVVNPGAGTVGTILEACYFGAGRDIDADEWAEIVVRLDETPLLVQVMIETLKLAAEDLGATWAPPSISTDGDAHTLHFFAYGTDFGDAYEVTVTRADDGVVTSQYDLIRPGG